MLLRHPSSLPSPHRRKLHPDNAVIAATIPLLFVAAIFQFFDGLQITATGALRGAGNTHAGLIVQIVGYWIIGLPIGYCLRFPSASGSRRPLARPLRRPHRRWHRPHHDLASHNQKTANRAASETVTQSLRRRPDNQRRRRPLQHTHLPFHPSHLLLGHAPIVNRRSCRVTDRRSSAPITRDRTHPLQPCCHRLHLLHRPRTSHSHHRQCRHRTCQCSAET